MSVIRRMRRQKAVYWQRGAADRYGTYAFEEPVEIDCRWVDRMMEILDSKGAKSISTSTVYVDRDMVPGDRLKQGEMDSTTPSDPMQINDAHEVKRVENIPNFKATETLWICYL